MALNKEVFRTRALSAIVFVIIMLGGLLWNHWSFLLLFSIIHVGCWWEYFNLQEKIQQTTYNFLSRVGMILFGYSLVLLGCGDTFQINGYHVAGSTVLISLMTGQALFLIGLYQNKLNKSNRTIVSAFFGVFYISLSIGLMLLLRQQNMNSFLGDFGWLYPMLLIASIWINDTMAYIVGSMIGKTPLSKISPKKTWEGTIGGALLAVVVVTGVAVWWLKADWKITAAIAATAAVTGTLGDLFESYLKRRAGVKDSGNMMPGHGGFLDRFDSLLIATPFAWLVVKIFE